MKRMHVQVDPDGHEAVGSEMRSVQGLAGLRVQRKPTKIPNR